MNSEQISNSWTVKPGLSSRQFHRVYEKCRTFKRGQKSWTVGDDNATAYQVYLVAQFGYKERHAMMRTIIDLYSDINAKETSTITIAALDGRKKRNVNSIGMLD